MRLKNIYLAFPIRAPWSTNFSDHLNPAPLDGQEAIACGEWLELREDCVVRAVVHISMVRYAEVDPQCTEEEEEEEHEALPVPKEPEAPTVLRRRGRQKKP